MPVASCKFFPLQLFQAEFFSISISFFLYSFASVESQGRAIQHKLTRSSELTSLRRYNQGIKPEGQNPLSAWHMCQTPEIKPDGDLLLSEHILFIMKSISSNAMSPVRVNADVSS